MSEPLRVAVRIRPPQPHDGKRCGPATVEKRDDTSLHIGYDGADRCFDFDRVFGPESSQAEVFASCALPVVEAVLAGTNGCIFAFGQTGAGKTHSMLGPEGGRRQDAQAGVLPRAAGDLFRRIAQLENDAENAIGAGGFSAFEVRASFIEVHCENAFDLLGSTVTVSRDVTGACPIREQFDPPRVYAEGAREERVTSTAQLLQLVAKGASNRATAATGVHAHSSRSHALLVLAVEHRWRSVDDPDPRRYLSRISRLTLVDLAGSETMERAHGGSVDSAGVGTNLGLLVLGRVIHALATGERVPYRDSTLTRLLQTSLGGTAMTQMLACISPAEIDVDHSFRTLQYATSARDVRVKPEVAGVREGLDTDPMIGDSEDADSVLNRRAIWIETREFGDVFARCVGDPADPLILWVHGSGPQNSSMFWNEVIMDVARLAQASAGGLPQCFYHVAIDCPGYGRSPGDRQTIRSYPGQLIGAVVLALGRRSVAAACGSSQGCAAVFNAALETPKLMHALAVCHPVAHAPERFTNILHPTLMIFDTEDDGHPVSVGRQLRRYLPNNRYFEFTRSEDGDWEAEHMGEELIALLSANWQQIKGKRRGGRLDPKLPELTRIAGGFRSWDEAHGGETTPMSGESLRRENGSEIDETSSWQGCSSVGADTNLWRAILDPSTNMLQYQHVQSGRISRLRPPGARILVERLDVGAAGSGSKVRSTQQARRETLFDEKDDESEDEEARREREAQAEQAAADTREREVSQIDCDRCGGPLFDPVRLVRCRCALCASCVEVTVRYIRQCPVCGENVEVKKGEPLSDMEELRARIAAREAKLEGAALADMEARKANAKESSKIRSMSCRIVLEYGNIAQNAGSKTSYITFVKTAQVEGFGKGAKGQMLKVDFNINPGFSKPTSTVNEPDAKSGATFEYAMARSYPCAITVHFAKELCLPQVVIGYYVQDAHRTARRIIVEFPRGGLSDRRLGQVRFDGDPPRNGWVRCAAGGAHDISYLDESDGSMRPTDLALPTPGPASRAGAAAKVKSKPKEQTRGRSPGVGCTASARTSSGRAHHKSSSASVAD